METSVCRSVANCPVDGNWASWGEWTTCSSTCVGGRRSRQRTCSNPAPSNDGVSCVGSSVEIDGACANATCGKFKGTRRRESEIQPCRSMIAFQDSILLLVSHLNDRHSSDASGIELGNGVWSNWASWSDCATTCKTDECLFSVRLLSFASSRWCWYDATSK